MTGHAMRLPAGLGRTVVGIEGNRTGRGDGARRNGKQQAGGKQRAPNVGAPVSSSCVAHLGLAAGKGPDFGSVNGKRHAHS